MEEKTKAPDVSELGEDELEALSEQIAEEHDARRVNLLKKLTPEQLAELEQEIEAEIANRKSSGKVNSDPIISC